MGNITTYQMVKETSFLDICKDVLDSFEEKNTRIEKYFKSMDNYYYKYPRTRESFIKLLNKFPPNVTNRDGQNLFHRFINECKCYSNDPDFLQILLDYGCDLNKRDDYGKTPIYYAKNPKSIVFCIKNRVDLTVRDNDNHTPLYYLSKGYYNDRRNALKENDPEYIHLLNIIDYSEFSPEERLSKAVWFQDKTKILEFLEANPDSVNQFMEEKPENYFNNTPLVVACRNDLYDEFMILLEHGADINQHKLICVLLSCYLSENRVKMVCELIERGVDLDVTSEVYTSVLHRCYSKNSEKIIRLFLEKGANADINKRTPYYEKRSYCRPELLFSNDADPLMYMTVYMPNIEVFRALLEHGADPNSQSKHGVTPFMGLFASTFLFNHTYIKTSNPEKMEESGMDKYELKYNFEPYLDLIQLFLDYGADLTIRDKHNHTALDYLVCNYYIPYNVKVNVIRFLKEKVGFFILNPNVNKFIYNVCLETWHEEQDIDLVKRFRYT